jgi:8-oxo-dGDP phosphatase
VEHEELDMTVERVPLDEAVQRVLAGGIRNASAVIGLLAVAQTRATGAGLRPAEAE